MDSTDSEPKVGERFNLIRYFTLTSLAAMIGVALLTALTFGAQMRNVLVWDAEADAVAVAQLIVEDFNAALDALTQAGVSIAWTDPQVQSRLSRSFAHSGGALNVIKIKAFDVTGRIVYSTDQTLINQVDADNLDLQNALAGYVTSKLARAKSAADLSGETFTVDVIETYVPVRGAPDSRFKVFEIYQDATDVLDQVATAQRLVVVVTAGIMLLLFLVLYLIIRRADQRVRQNEYDLAERMRAEQVLEAYSERLEEMVTQRTNELHEAQEQLLQQEKLATLGQVAGTMAHELNNPLGGIKNAAYFVKLVLDQPEPEVAEALEIVEREVGTAVGIINSLLGFARIKGPLRREIDVNDVVRDALSRVAVPDAPRVEVVCDLDGTLPTISADPDQLAQVFGNLILNAVQAMPEGGQLTVESVASSPDCVTISISDTGVGIPEENLGKIFEPLFTTRAKGIGLGLALVKTLVEGHGGSVAVQSDGVPGKGSTFVVNLPVGGGAT